jgi:hypothetical protein
MPHKISRQKFTAVQNSFFHRKDARLAVEAGKGRKERIVAKKNFFVAEIALPNIFPCAQR